MTGFAFCFVKIWGFLLEYVVLSSIIERDVSIVSFLMLDAWDFFYI